MKLSASDERFAIVMHELKCGPHFKQLAGGRERVLGCLLDGSNVVDHHQAAAVRGDDEIIVTRMNDQVEDLDRRKSIPSSPASAAIRGDIESLLGSDVENIHIPRIFLNHIH